jgi:hypothetical protein
MHDPALRLKILLLAGAALGACQRAPEPAAANAADANAAAAAAPLAAQDMNATAYQIEAANAADMEMHHGQDVLDNLPHLSPPAAVPEQPPFQPTPAPPPPPPPHPHR